MAQVAEPAGLQIVAGLTYVSDDNYLRRSDSAPPSAFFGRADASERLRVSQLGLRYDQAWGLQRLSASLDVLKYEHRHFTFLDFTARNSNVLWNWAVTPRTTGELAWARTEQLNDLADINDLNQRALRIDTTRRASVSHELGAAWRLLGGLSHRTETRGGVLAQEGDTSTRSASVGLQHVWPSGSAVSYNLRQHSGRFLNRSLTSAALLDSGYTQRDHVFDARWPVTGLTTLGLQFSHISRHHPNFSQRDYSGWQGGVTVDWAPSGLVQWQASWRRSLGSFQAVNANYTVSDRFTIGPMWQLSAKTQLSAGLIHEQRQELGQTGLAPLSGRQDTIRSLTINGVWALHDNLRLSAGLSRASRTSTAPIFDYHSLSTTLSLNLTF